MSGEQLHYPQCRKGNCHVGEVLNLVCLEPSCIHKSIICGICYDEEHRNHKIRPLKMIINNSKKYLSQLTPMSFDLQKVRSSVTVTRNKLLTTFDKFDTYVKQSLSSIRETIEAIFVKVIDQIELKNGRNAQLLTAIEDIKTKDMEYTSFVALMQKLLAGVPIDIDEEETDISRKDIEQAVQKIQVKVQKNLKQKEIKIKEEIHSFMSILQKINNNPSVFNAKLDFKFSNQLKHQGIELISQTIVKSNENDAYHFALMEPSVQERANTACQVSFKIKNDSHNWLGVGLCYKNAMIASNYIFNSCLGHGAYLISSNRGSWSSHDPSKNSTVTSFSFTTDDTIIVEYEPSETKIVFRKKGSDETYTLEYEVREDDELHLCTLLYYINNEIEYLGQDN